MPRNVTICELCPICWAAFEKRNRKRNGNDLANSLSAGHSGSQDNS